ncbi:hypothetical protein CLIB1423_04S06216 [[Candida] railenensis]|uniref:Uncharacterized protein n=1 Tax=[Candida] railenensis TaxID=45579 RepID=A0A9P0VXD5_9ASCO|nr:hypothetical protein CLIB1423_04S06216 [[Candida] railenensis]
MPNCDEGNSTIELSSSTSYATDNTRSESESPNEEEGLKSTSPADSDGTLTSKASKFKLSSFRKGIFSSPLVKRDSIIKSMIRSIEKYHEEREEEMVVLRRRELEAEKSEQERVAKRRKLVMKDEFKYDLALRVNCIIKYSGTGSDTQPNIFNLFAIDFLVKTNALSSSDQILALRFQLVDEAKDYYFEVRDSLESGTHAIELLREKFVVQDASLTTEAKFRIMSGFKKIPSKHPVSELFWYDSRAVYRDLVSDNTIKEREYLDFAIYKLRPYTLRNYVTSRMPETEKEARAYCIEFEEKKQKQKKGEKAPI